MERMYAPKNEDVCENIEHKIKRRNTERKFTQERKVCHRGCLDLGNFVALRRKWQEALQMNHHHSALRMHVALSPWATAQRPARDLKHESHHWSRRNWVCCKNSRRSARNDEVRWPGAREKGCRLPTRMSEITGSLGG
jgi:hypothetical protein